MSDIHPKIDIYTDGGADPNPGPGGWAAILLHPKETKELSGGEMETTNNRMELTAAIKALEALKQSCEINFYTDSEYLRNGITQWIEGWKRKNWAKVQNVDLWQRLDELVERHTIDWHWVKGHAGNKYNERADELATAAMPRTEIKTDPNVTRVYLRIAGNPQGTAGAGGWAAAIVRGEEVEIVSGGHPKISVNHLSLYGALQALKSLPADEPLQVFTNNSYLHTGITDWVKGWKRKNWSGEIKFTDDWKALDQIQQSQQIQWVIWKGNKAPTYFDMLEEAVTQAREKAKTMK